MAIYRLHRKEWDKGRQKDFPTGPEAAPKSNKRKRIDADTDESTGVGRKGVSSGLSTVIKRRGGKREEKEKNIVVPKGKDKWWTELRAGSSGQAKGSVRVSI